MINPQITSIPEKKLLGMNAVMNFVHYGVSDLWRNFMPRIREIRNRAGSEMISMAMYDPSFFVRFDPQKTFEKWAAVEVENLDEIPAGMSAYILPAGLYAVFHYQGTHTDNSIYQYIFSTWLPSSGYQLDVRPHFEVLGEKYRNNHPESEEDIYIPIRKV